jgi:hypothetical protein
MLMAGQDFECAVAIAVESLIAAFSSLDARGIARLMRTLNVK